jgi:tripartite-type tricarboxylate transporter receptor subunit TctC
LAKLNNRPLASLPELQPLAIAADLPELKDISTWAGLVAPAGTPPDVIDVIQRAAAKASMNGELRQRLDKLGIAAVSSTPDEFRRYIARERDRWSKVVGESGLKFD